MIIRPEERACLSPARGRERFDTSERESIESAAMVCRKVAWLPEAGAKVEKWAPSDALRQTQPTAVRGAETSSRRRSIRAIMSVSRVSVSLPQHGQ